MNTTKWLVTGLATGVVMFLLGYLAYGLLLSSIFEANMGTAQGVMRGEDSMVWWALVLGNLLVGLLYALIVGEYANARNLADGAKVGALVGFISTLGFQLINHATTNIAGLNAVFIDAVLWIVIGGILGAVVGALYGRGAEA